MTTVYVSQNGDAIPGERYVGTNSAPIKQALEYLYTIGGGEVFIENGSYYLNSVINISQSNIKVRGEGLHTKLIPFSGASQTTLFTVKGSSTNMLTKITIEDISFGWGKEASIGGNGLVIDYVEDAVIKGCYFRDNRAIGLQMLNSKNIEIENNVFQGNTEGFRIENSSSCSFVNNISQQNSTNGVYSNRCTNIMFANNIIQQNSRNGLSIENGSYINISNNIFKNNTQCNISNQTSSLYTTASNNIMRNSPYALYQSGNSNYSNIFGNVITEVTSGIHLQSTSKSICSGNSISSTNNGIVFESSTLYTVITGNQISSNVSHGIYIPGNASFNTISGNSMSIESTSSSSYSMLFGSSTQNNNFINNAYKNILNGGTNNLII